jgi:hypothetical protein
LASFDTLGGVVKNRVFLLALSLTIAITSGDALAKLGARTPKFGLKKLKNIYEVIQIKPEFKHLDPVNAFIMANQGILNYRYRFGSENDHRNVFIQKIFNSPSDSPTFFRANPHNNAIGRLLGPSTIGKILSLIHTGRYAGDLGPRILEMVQNDVAFKANLKASEEERDKLRLDQRIAETQKRLETTIQELKASEKTFSEIQKIYDEAKIKVSRKNKRERKKNRKEAADCSEEKSVCEQGEQLQAELSLKAEDPQLEDLRAHLEAQEKEIKDLRVKREAAKEDLHNLKIEQNKYAYSPKDLGDFVEVLLKSLKADQGEKDPRFQHYTEEVLMALAFTNGVDKLDLIKLYMAMPDVLEDTSKRKLLFFP